MKGDSQPVEVCLRPLRKIQTPIGSSKVLNHQILLQRLVNSTGTSASSYTLQQTLRDARRQTHTLIRLWKHTFSFHHWDFYEVFRISFPKKRYHQLSRSFTKHQFLSCVIFFSSPSQSKTLMFSRLSKWLLLPSKNFIHFHAGHTNISELVLLRYALMIFI